MIARFSSIIYLLLLSGLAFAQDAIIQGTIVDDKTKEALFGVNVYLNESVGTTTDGDGKFTLEVTPGSHVVQVSYLGYKGYDRQVKVKAGETITIDVGLFSAAEELNIVTVSGSKRERRLVEETASIEVIDNELIENTNSVTLNEAIDKIAGVNIFDGQITIRGGSGYAFGAGSRVLLLLDGLPLLSVDRGEIRWNFIPLEITEQVEVLKSASAALYGASALNGVVSVNTTWPGEKPETEAAVYYNMYAMPKNKEAAWWKKTISDPLRYGFWFSHKRKFGNWDLVTSVNYNKSVGYVRLLDVGHRRVSVKLRHRPEKIKGLSYGVSLNMMDSEEGDYFFWDGNGADAYIPYESTGNSDKGTLSLQRRKTLVADPWATYFDKSGNKHSLKTRISHIDLRFTAANPNAQLLIGEYQFQRRFGFGLTVTGGLNGQKYFLRDEDLGDHKGSISAAYAQLEQKYKRLTVSTGFRYEYFTLDKTATNGRPVGSFGVNYQVGKSTYLRGSFGQGFRFPSVAERFINESVGPVTIFPNPDLKPEYGFNGEIGLKQGVAIGDFLAFLDLSFFWMEYWDMTEFVFDIYLPDTIPEGKGPTDYLGFKSQNVSRARVAGMEASVLAKGELGKVPVRWQGGYTYNYPVDLGQNPELSNAGAYLGQFFKSIAGKGEDILAPMLAYRVRHQVKSDIEVDLAKVTLGLDTRYYGRVEKVDDIFLVFIPGLEEYRVENDRGNFLLNVRGSYSFGKFGKFTLVVNNVLNREISVRPARMEAPLNFAFQYKVNI